MTSRKLNGRRRGALTAACWLALAGSAAAYVVPAQVEAAPLAFAIDAGVATETLREFGRQAALQTLFDYEQLKNIRTQAVTGTLEPEAALSRMLEGTGLTFERTDAKTIAIRVGGTKGKVSTADTTEVIDQVIVTGSNIRMNASELDKSALPVEIISNEKLQMTASEQVGNYLRNQSFVAGDNLQPLNDGFNGARTTINLRGLGAAYTLALANGRRFASEDSITDIGAIPPEAIESVEVLKSGASAVFGSAAVGGVVNFKLKNRFDGVELFASGGNTTNHDAAYRRGAVLFGKQFDRLRLVGSLSYSDRNAIERFDRDLTSNSDFRRFGGFDRRIGVWGLAGIITLPSAPGQRLMLDLDRFQPGQTGSSPSDYEPFDPDRYAFSAGAVSTVPQQTRTGGHWVLEYDLLDDERLVLFTNGFFDRNKVVNKGAQVVASALPVPASNPYNPFGEDVNVTYIFGLNELAPVTTDFDSDSSNVVVGLRGKLGQFDYEVAASRSQYKQVADNGTTDMVRSLVIDALARTDATALNLFGNGANSAAQLAGLSLPHASRSRNRLDTIDAKLSGPILSLPAGDVMLAMGVERRESSYGSSSDLVWQTNSFLNTGMRGPDTSYDRQVNAAFAELRVPVYRGDAGAFLNSVEFGTAGRYEDYSDFGSTDVKQANLRFGFLDEQLILRASFAEGFRAPYVSQLAAPQSTGIATGFFDPVRGGFFPITIVSGGNTNLKPETADTYNYGVIVAPQAVPGLTLRADYWKVDLTNRIVTPSTQSLLDGTSTVGSITRDPVTGDVSIDARLDNGGTLETSGIDFGASYSLRTAGFGRFNFDLNTTYTLDYYDGSVGDQNIIGRFNTTLLAALPRFRGTLGTYWSMDGWSASLTFNYTQGVKDVVVMPAIDRTTANYVTGNLHVGYDFADSAGLAGALHGLSVYVGVENLWDETIPFIASSPTGFDRSLVDYRGRYIYAGLRKRL